MSSEAKEWKLENLRQEMRIVKADIRRFKTSRDTRDFANAKYRHVIDDSLRVLL